MKERCYIKMHSLSHIGLLLLIINSSYVFCDSILATINSDDIINVVSDKFISFTIDPQIILEKNNIDNGKECLCMANLLSPAYLRIAGPSTEHIAIEESIIKFNKTELNDDEDVQNIGSKSAEYVETSVEKWKNFMNWVELAGLTPIVALNNVDRFPCGNWNPKSAIQALTVVEQSNVGECVWQLGDECRNQSTQKYMNDLQVLKILIDAFSSGKNGKWKIASADISQCLGDDESKNLMKFLLESNSFLNAVVLHSNGTNDLLNMLKKTNKEKVQRQLKKKNTELWKTIKNNGINDDDALLWLKSIGNAAKDGYAVVFKDLTIRDIEDWSMSYFVSLLHKKFVGPEALNITINSTDSDVSVFGHCSTLPSRPATNGVTLFASNEKNSSQLITFNITMEEEGEIMQFIIKNNENGSVFINGIETFNDGDMQPDVRHVKPFKAFKVTIPAKSVGFWVLPSANVKACYGIYTSDNTVKRNKNKNMGTGRIAETLYQIMHEREELLENKRRRRSALDTQLSNEFTNMNDLKMQLMLDDLDINYSNEPDDNSDQTDVKTFNLLEDIEKMIKLEEEFIKIGTALLNMNYFDDFQYDEEMLDYDQQLPSLVRVIRDLNFDDNVKEETIQQLVTEIPSEIQEVDVEKTSIKSSTIKLPVINAKKINETLSKIAEIIKNVDMTPSENVKVESVSLPKLKLPKIDGKLSKIAEKARSAVKSIEIKKVPKLIDGKLSKLVEKARSIVKNSDMTPSENANVESVVEAPKIKSSGSKDGLLKHDVKFSEIKDRLKARLAEIRSNLDQSKISKREVDLKNGGSYFIKKYPKKHKNSIRKKRSLDLNNNLSSENMIETSNEIDIKSSNTAEKENYSNENLKLDRKSLVIELNDDANKIHKIILEQNSAAHDSSSDSDEKILWDDIKDNVSELEMNEDMFEGMVKKVHQVLTNLKDKLSELWSSYVTW